MDGNAKDQEATMIPQYLIVLALCCHVEGEVLGLHNIGNFLAVIFLLAHCIVYMGGGSNG